MCGAPWAPCTPHIYLYVTITYILSICQEDPRCIPFSTQLWYLLSQSPSATFTHKKGPPTFVQGLKDLTVTDGDEVELTVQVKGKYILLNKKCLLKMLLQDTTILTK